ncbi:PE domain-containing protein [Amycolatopsis sp. NPDC059021]|uniref:PE domain-containing protein n=1 Tax=Amycolatopsis sp. NPDC059021 TaxID=3346704 RepID=UPI00366B7286
MPGTPATTEGLDLTGAVPVAPGVADVMVDPDKLLAVAKVVEEQVKALEDKLLTRLGQLRIDSPSADIISTNAVEAWNGLVADGDQSYAGQVREYVAGLHRLVAQLREAAKKYSTGEADKAAALRERGGHRT